MTRARLRRLPALAVLAVLLAAPAAHADSLVYVKAGQVWVSQPDGTQARPVTPADSNWAWPSESDDGVIAVAGGAERVNPGGSSESSGSSEIYAFDQQGNSLLSTPVSTPGSVSSPSSPTYVDHFRISPDGRTVAYDVIGCCGFSGETTFLSPLRSGAGWSQYMDDFVSPGWVDASAEIGVNPAIALTHNGATIGTQPEYAFFDPADSGHNLGWNQDAAIPDGWHYEASFPRRGDRVALFLDDAPNNGGTVQNVRIHLETINPDLSTTDRCTIDRPASQFPEPHHLSQVSVSFTTDASLLAWGEADGIHEANVSDPSVCSEQLVIPGGAMPSFGAAALSAPSRQGGQTSAGALTSPRSYRIRKLLSRGLPVSVRVNAGGSLVKVELLSGGSSRAAAARTKVLARVVKRGLKAGRHRLVLKLSRKGRAALRHARKLNATVKLTITPPGGGSEAATNRIRLKR